MELKKLILENIDQKIIYGKYLGIGIEDINYCLSTRNAKISNPLRYDPTPSLSFKYYGDKLIARDFGDRNYRGDIFEIVGYIINKNSNNPKHFIEICDDIMKTCSKDNNNFRNYISQEREITDRKHFDIEAVFRTLNTNDILFYNRFGLKEHTIRNNIKSVETYYLNTGNTQWKANYKYKLLDPCYYYNVNINKAKLYFPYRTKQEVRFITNNNICIEDIHKLRYIDYVILIKSQKDKLLLNQMLDEMDIDNILVLTIASETIKIDETILKTLFKYCQRKLFVMLDYDRTGLQQGEYFKSLNIEPLYFTEGYTKSKDPTDMVKDYGYSKTLNQFEFIIKNKIHAWKETNNNKKYR